MFHLNVTNHLQKYRLNATDTNFGIIFPKIRKKNTQIDIHSFFEKIKLCLFSQDPSF